MIPLPFPLLFPFFLSAIILIKRQTGFLPSVILREMNRLSFFCNGHPLPLYVLNCKINKRSANFWCGILDVAEPIEWYFMSIIFCSMFQKVNQKFFFLNLSNSKERKGFSLPFSKESNKHNRMCRGMFRERTNQMLVVIFLISL